MYAVIALLSCLVWGNQENSIPLSTSLEHKIVFVHENPLSPSSFIPKKHFANCFCHGNLDQIKEDDHRILISPKFGVGDTLIVFDKTIDELKIPKTALTSLAVENELRRDLLGLAIGARFSKKSRTTLKVKIQGKHVSGSYRIEVLPTLIDGNKTAKAWSPEVWILDGNTLTMVEPASGWSFCLL